MVEQSIHMKLRAIYVYIYMYMCVYIYICIYGKRNIYMYIQRQIQTERQIDIQIFRYNRQIQTDRQIYRAERLVFDLRLIIRQNSQTNINVVQNVNYSTIVYVTLYLLCTSKSAEFHVPISSIQFRIFSNIIFSRHHGDHIDGRQSRYVLYRAAKLTKH